MNRTMIILLTLVTLLTMCRPKTTSTEQAPLSVEVLTIDSTTSVLAHSYVGKTEDADVISLSFGVTGTIEQVYVHNGESVCEGQALVALDVTKSESALRTAEAKLAQAQDGYQRVKQVYDEGGVSEVKMTEITTQLSEAEQLVRALENQVEGCTLRAPIAGVIEDVRVHAGQNILPDLEVLKLHNRAGKKVVYSVPEQDIVRVKVNDEVLVRILTLGNRVWRGYVVERSLSANAMAQSYEVKCALEGNTDAILPGMSCKVESKADQVTGYRIPAHCVQTMGDGLCVWVSRDGVAERIRVESSSFGRDGVLITSGLQKGDQVIVNGYQKVYSGCRLQRRQ